MQQIKTQHSESIEKEAQELENLKYVIYPYQ